MLKIQVIKAEDPVDGRAWVKCPRCQRRHGVLENYDFLCDRCCAVLLADYPELDYIEDIREAIAAQRTKYKK